MNLQQDDFVAPYELTRDFLIVWVDNIWETAKTRQGIITLNDAFTAKQNVEETEERGESKRRYGRVMSLPMSLSDDVMVDIIEPSSPQPRKFIGHEYIQKMNRRRERGFRNHENPRSRYYPSTFEKYEFVSVYDVAKNNTVKVGDKVYFTVNATDLERYLGPYKDGHLFSMRADEILCTIKLSPIFQNHEHYTQKTIIPQNDWVFAQLDMEDWKDITKEIAGKTVYLKVAPEALPLRGKVIAGPDGLKDKHIFFEREADAPINVEGMDLTCMRKIDVLATLKPKIK